VNKEGAAVAPAHIFRVIESELGGRFVVSGFEFVDDYRRNCVCVMAGREAVMMCLYGVTL
jgi:hypothetical protein